MGLVVGGFTSHSEETNVRCSVVPWSRISNSPPLGLETMQLWVSLVSEAACAAALQHAVAMYDIHDTETLQAVLQYVRLGLLVPCAQHCGQKRRAAHPQALFRSASQWQILAHRRPTI